MGKITRSNTNIIHAETGQLLKLSHSAAKTGSRLSEGILQQQSTQGIILFLEYVLYYPKYLHGRGIILANTPPFVVGRSLKSSATPILHIEIINNKYTNM